MTTQPLPRKIPVSDTNPNEPIFQTFMEEVDARIFALLVPDDAPPVSFTHTYVAAEGGRITVHAMGDNSDGSRAWEYTRTFGPPAVGGVNYAAMEFLFALNAVKVTEEHGPGFRQQRATTEETR